VKSVHKSNLDILLPKTEEFWNAKRTINNCLNKYYEIYNRLLSLREEFKRVCIEHQKVMKETDFSQFRLISSSLTSKQAEYYCTLLSIYEKEGKFVDAYSIAKEVGGNRFLRSTVTRYLGKSKGREKWKRGNPLITQICERHYLKIKKRRRVCFRPTGIMRTIADVNRTYRAILGQLKEFYLVQLNEVKSYVDIIHFSQHRDKFLVQLLQGYKEEMERYAKKEKHGGKLKKYYHQLYEWHKRGYERVKALMNYAEVSFEKESARRLQLINELFPQYNRLWISLIDLLDAEIKETVTDRSSASIFKKYRNGRSINLSLPQEFKKGVIQMIDDCLRKLRDHILDNFFIEIEETLKFDPVTGILKVVDLSNHLDQLFKDGKMGRRPFSKKYKELSLLLKNYLRKRERHTLKNQ